MSAEAFSHDVFLSHSAKDKAMVPPLAGRLRECVLKVRCDEWVLNPAVPLAHRMGEGPGVRAAKIEEGLEHTMFGFRISGFGFAKPGMPANAFGSDGAQLETSTCGRGNFRERQPTVRNPLNQGCRFIPPYDSRTPPEKARMLLGLASCLLAYDNFKL